MLIQHTTITLILTFMSVSNLFGQYKLRDNIVSDSIIRKLKIKQVTVDWFHDSLQLLPAYTTIEKYNEFSQKTQRIEINYFYHKFIYNYQYKGKKNVIIETQYYYDWNPFRQMRIGDTIVKKTTTKYDMTTLRNLKAKPSRLERFQPKLTFDNANRLIERIDTIKCGHKIIYYTYDNNNKVIERKHYTSHHSEEPFLFAVDSLHYNKSGHLVKETSYYNIKIKEDKWVFNREVITTYSYYQNGLIQKRTNVTKYQSLNNRTFNPSVSIYKYEFY